MREKLITTSQVKQYLESIGEESLDQFQRRTLDYTIKFSKVNPTSVEQLITKLAEFDILEEEAVQILNCMPESIEELRTFLAGGRRIMEASKLKEILTLLNDHRKRK